MEGRWIEIYQGSLLCKTDTDERLRIFARCVKALLIYYVLQQQNNSNHQSRLIQVIQQKTSKKLSKYVYLPKMVSILNKDTLKLQREMQISVSNQAEAKKMIGNIFNQRKTEFKQSECLQISQWLNETNSVRCYMLKEDTLLSFAILSKMDFDPWNMHKDPWTLNFIYTFPKHRRRGCAKKLLGWIKKRQETTAFCSNQESQKLFDSLQFFIVGVDPIPIYRFP